MLLIRFSYDLRCCVTWHLSHMLCSPYIFFDYDPEELYVRMNMLDLGALDINRLHQYVCYIS